MTKEEFWKSLDSLSLDDDTMAHIENKRVIETIGKNIEECIPDKLYRYRSFDSHNYSISALDKNETWASSLSEMNDYLEYDPFWSPDDVLETIKDSICSLESLDFNSLAEQYPGFSEVFGKTNDLELLKVKENKERIIRYSEYVFEEVKVLIKALKEAPWIVTDMIKNSIMSTYVSCFSEDGYSNIMAGLYSDGAKSFILEYNTKELLFPCIKKEECDHTWACHTLLYSPLLIPVNYQKERYDISKMLSSAIFQLAKNNFMNKLFGVETPTSSPSFHTDYLYQIKLAGRKQSIWKHEKEWRLIYFEEKEEPNKNKHIPISMVKPSSIILCPNCSKENKDKIQGIANSHSIPLYQLMKDYNNRDYSVFRKEIICS